MEIVIYAILGFSLLVIVMTIVLLERRKGALTNTGAQSYDVFAVSGNQLTVLAGIPVTYKLDEIKEVTFSTVKAPRSMSVYNGIMRIVKVDGKKSRPFMFNSSAYARKTVLASSRQEIEETIGYLMGELKQYHIRCSRRR